MVATTMAHDGARAVPLDDMLDDIDAAGGKRRRNGSAGRPLITVLGGRRHEAADRGLEAMETARVGFYQRGGAIVRVCGVPAKNVDGEIIHVPGIVPVTAPMLGRALGKSADWVRIGKQGERIATDPPKDVVD